MKGFDELGVNEETDGVVINKAFGGMDVYEDIVGVGVK